MRRKPVLLTGAAALAVLLIALAVVLVPRLTDRGGQQDAAASFARAWSGGTLAQQPWDPASGPDPAGEVAASTARLTAAATDRPATVDVVDVRRQGD